MNNSFSEEMLEQCLHERLDTLTGFGDAKAKRNKLVSIFKRVDRNGSCAVDMHEFQQAMGRQLNMVDVDLSPLFNKYDVDMSGELDYEEFADGICGLATTSADLDPTTRSVLGQLRNAIAVRGGLNGIRSLGRVFRIIDDSGNRTIDRDEFKFGLADMGLQFSDKKLNMIFTAFDKDNSGGINFEEFLRGVRGKMSKRRRDLVLMAFDVVDRDGSGHVTVEDLVGVYDASLHPDVVDGSATPEEVLEDFLGQWEFGERDGIVTKKEFLEYYADISASCDNDEYFELMIRNAWHMAGGEGAAQNTSNLRVLVVFKDGRQEVIGLVNDLGVKGETAIKLQLYKQGIPPDSILRIETTY